MTTSDKAVSVDNLGPISHFEFSGSKPGITVFSGPNGIGKSIFQAAIETAAAGKGRVPLRDHSKSGKVDAFGATITIGANCRHTGKFEVLSLNGRINLADLVDPRKETPSVCDGLRIKALVSMTGVEASVDRFRLHEAFAETFDSVVNPESKETDDLVEMARRIQKNYYDAAGTQEQLAARKTALATAMAPPPDLDMTEECDAEILQATYNAARDEVTRLAEQQRTAKASADKIRLAKESLEAIGDDNLTKDRETFISVITDGELKQQANIAEIAALRTKIKELETENTNYQSRVIEAKRRLISVDNQLALVETAKRTLQESVTEFPDDDDISDANEELEVAQKAIETGTLIRAAKTKAKEAQGHRAAAKAASELAIKYRDAGKATDTVLSDAINCPYLRVESDGKAARLYADTVERGKTLYHDLSDGQKYRIAIDIGADQVGEDGLLTVDQIGWEGIDADNRVSIDAHAKARGVHIWVLEASREVGAPREIVAKQFDPDALPHAPKPPAKPADVPEAKPKAAKAAPKPKAPAKPPAPVVPDDDEDVPF